MPTYEYACRECGEHLEVVQSFKDDALTVCPNCQGELRKVFSAAGIIFKGSGWHIKDYKDGGAASRPAAATSGSDSSETASGSDKKDAGSAASEGTSETKSSGSSDGSGKSSSSGSSSSSESKSA